MIPFRSHLQATRPWIELARLHKPAGALLILWPFIWGLAMAARAMRTPPLIFSRDLVVGCVCSAQTYSTMLSSDAGCTWNDIVDRDLDKQVERTKNRPLADGRISVPGSLAFLSVHLVFLSVSVMQCGNEQSFLGLVTIFPLAGGYPFMKRISHWPQAWLGMAFNMGTIMSWSWATGKVPRSGIALAFTGWFWTMWYDTIYGTQDKKDDIKIGIGSTALLFKSTTISRIFLAFHGSMFVFCLTVSGILNGVHAPFSPYYLIGVGGSIFHLGKQFWSLDLDSPASCWSAFCNNAFVVGPTVALGLIAEYLLLDVLH
ncbi:UbiA prenyltransferase family [Mycena sp. CBHHK59/15]|nr:UbiA prenyltransferase family [Mycena sp. CBHHK59/15]